jgi:enterobacterial common antigen flippase
MAATLPREPANTERPSYVQILRSSALIGAASGVNLAIGILRTKALALLLGPAGIGLIGLYTSLTDLARSVAQLGINGSGVRQIAEAVAADDAARLATTVTVLRRAGVVLGLAGALLLVAGSRQVSVWTFGDERHASAVAWLSLAVFFRVVADGQGALIQGMRRIAELARIGVLGSLAGAIASIALVAWLRDDGIVAAVVAMAGLGALASWWYSRSVRVRPVRMSGLEVRREAASLLTLGLAFMASALLMVGAAFAVRLIVLRQVGLAQAGLFQAAWTLGGLYVGVVLQAMGADFYPRLVAAIQDRRQASRLVNEQSQVSLLLGAPGVIATLAFAAPVIGLFYSAEFQGAVEVLRWITLGMALRVITWPIGYIVVATNQRLVFFATELAWTLANVGLSWLCVGWFGLAGAGIAFFASYVFHAVLIYAVVRRLYGFRWSRATWTSGLAFVASIGVVVVAMHSLPPLLAMGAGTLVLLASGGYALWTLLTLLPPESLPPFLQRLRTPAVRAEPV